MIFDDEGDAISYFVLPLGLVGLHGIINLGWLGQPSNLSSVVAFVMLLVMTYETGFKKYYAVGRRLYFYFVFLVPLILSSASLVIWFASR
jgi:hypothetical protein